MTDYKNETTIEIKNGVYFDPHPTCSMTGCILISGGMSLAEFGEYYKSNSEHFLKNYKSDGFKKIFENITFNELIKKCRDHVK